MSKGLEELIKKKKTEIVKNWFEATTRTYAPDTAQFIKGQKDQFANPIGSITLKGIEFLLNQLLNGPDPKAIKSYLDPIIRIRAVQDFAPSHATAFTVLLKKVIRDSLDKELQDSQRARELLEFESKIDQLCLMAFDVYMECREKLYQIQANETRKRTLRAFERAGLIAETSKNGSKVKPIKH